MNPLELVSQLGAWGQQHQHAVLYGLGAAPLLLGGASLLRRRVAGDPTTHGSARWATPREVRQAGLYARQGVVIGKIGRHILHDESETHLLLMGPTRSRKGVGTIGCTLRQSWRESVLATDPKDGENYDLSADARRAMGQDVALFCPYKAPQARINVLKTIRFGQPEENRDADIIAYSLTAPAKMRQESQTSLHFRTLARMLLKAVILHVGYTARVQSLAGCWHFMTQQYPSLLEALDAMRGTSHTSYGVHEAIASLTRAITNITGDRELGSIWSTAIQPLELYNDYYVAASTDTSTLNLQDLQYGPRPLSLYLAAPSPADLERLHPLYRVVTDVAMHQLQQHKPRSWRSRLLFCGDELPLYGYSKTIDKDIAVVAGYGIKMLVVAQDLPMLEDTYGVSNGVWGNTNLKIFHTPVNDATARRISETLMGRGTVAHPVESRQAGLLGQRSVSYQHVARALMTPDEVQEMPILAQIVRCSGVKPISCAKVDYRTEPAFGGRRAA